MRTRINACTTHIAAHCEHTATTNHHDLVSWRDFKRTYLPTIELTMCWVSVPCRCLVSPDSPSEAPGAAPASKDVPPPVPGVQMGMAPAPTQTTSSLYTPAELYHTPPVVPSAPPPPPMVAAPSSENGDVEGGKAGR